MGETARAATPLGRLLWKAEAISYWLAVAPLAARLPARLGYRVACWRGDLTARSWPEKRAEIAGNLRQVLGDELGPEEIDRQIRDLFRFTSCEVVDVMRLRGRARPLSKLMEVRGREHLEAALAGGKGALLCSAHFGSHASAMSVLHASGFPLTTIGRWEWNYDTGVSPIERRFWDRVYARRLLRHRKRPNIEPWPGRIQVAAQAAVALRANEVVMIAGDTPPLTDERPRTIEVPFLGQTASIVPGVVTLALLTRAPVLMAFVHRSADYRHQVLEISPPVPMDGKIETAFARCATAIDAVVRACPGGWSQWETDDLVRLGLLPAARPEETVASDPPALVEDHR